MGRRAEHRAERNWPGSKPADVVRGMYSYKKTSTPNWMRRLSTIEPGEEIESLVIVRKLPYKTDRRRDFGEKIINW